MQASRPLPGDTTEAPDRALEIPSVLNIHCKETLYSVDCLLKLGTEFISLELGFTVSI